MSRNVLAAVIALGCAGCRPESVADCGEISIGAGGRVTCEVPGWLDRAFTLATPDDWDGVAPLPLIVAFHGGGGNREGARSVTCRDGNLADPICLDTMAKARGYAVVTPDGTGHRPLRNVRTWNAGGSAYCASGAACALGVDDLGYTDDLLDEIRAAIPVDPQRVYATGLSNGGAMSHRLACERAGVFAAIAAVGGGNQHGDDGFPCEPSAVLHIHGTEDRCWPYDGGGGDCIENEGRKTSVDETMTGWTARNGCSAEDFEDTAIPDRDPADGATAARRRWQGCLRSTELITVTGGGHTWPSGWAYLDRAGRVTFDFGNEVILNFFDANLHPNPRP